MTESYPNQQINRYFSIIQSQLDNLLERQRESMAEVAHLWTEAIKQDKLLYAFGSGHSRFISGELYWRAGGLAPVMTIEDPSNGAAERMEGYAATFMEQYNIQAGDLLLVISTSGINAVPIEVAQYGRDAGATVIALTGYSSYKDAASRHSSGKRLFELADVVLDTMVEYGDAVIALDGSDWRVAATSTLVSVGMLNAIVAQTAQNLMDAGAVPPVLVSSNVPDGDAHNRSMSDKYWQRLTKFPRKRVM